ncbi:hypothetical protein ACKWTF_016539 [Chironomus riparius]
MRVGIFVLVCVLLVAVIESKPSDVSESPCKSDTCGIRAQCRVINELPVCVCEKGYKGNPFTECIKKD